MQPLLIFDGYCGFCRTWVERWKKQTGGRVEYVPYQEAAPRFPHIPQKEFEQAVKFIDVDGTVSSGAEAVFRVLAHGGRTFPLWCYRYLPGFRIISERVYRFVAAHRGRGTCAVPRK